MYLAETDDQTNSSNTIHIEIIQSMEQVMDAIDSFAGATLLQGKTYNTAKTYMSAVFRPLAQGIIDLSEELIRQNSNYPNDFRSQVATTDVIEDKVKMQIDKINDLIDKVEPVNDALPVLNPIISIYQDMKRTLERKLEHLYEFNTATSDNYDLALELADNVLEGLNQVHNNNGFNSKDGTFSTEKMDLDWISKLNETQSMIKARDKFPDYYEENKDFENDKEKKNNIEKLIKVIDYEENNPDRAKDTDEFLTPLEEQDVVEIKYLMYTAEEPYRSLAMDYLDRFEVVKLTPKVRKEKDIDSNGVFRYSEDAIFVEMSKLRKDDRGNYYTFFHEIAHAFDYYYGQDNRNVFQGIYEDVKEQFGNSTFFTDRYKIDGRTLTDQMYGDAENNFRKELAKELESTEYEVLNSDKKQKMIDNVTRNLMEQNELAFTLSSEELELQKEIERIYRYDLLEDAEHNTASDVYGGVTNNTVRGRFWHEDYWFNDYGSRIKEPNREGFAEYFGRIIADDGIEKPGIQSINRYLPSSKKHMDEIFELMGQE